MVDELDGRVLDPSSPIHAVVEMPHLRRLASQGALFVNTYVTSPQCVPSRTTMSVGLRSHAIGMWDQSRGIVAVDGDPSRLDHYCIANYGEPTCRQWAQDQRAPPTFFDVANRSAVNVSIIGKLHIGAGLVSQHDLAHHLRARVSGVGHRTVTQRTHRRTRPPTAGPSSTTRRMRRPASTTLAGRPGGNLDLLVT